MKAADMRERVRLELAIEELGKQLVLLLPHEEGERIVLTIKMIVVVRNIIAPFHAFEEQCVRLGVASNGLDGRVR